MHIEKLVLINFKNYQDISIEFEPHINCILGKNGSGKTNLLDAIYYLSTTKSAINAIDSQNINFEKSFFTIKGEFVLEDDYWKVRCTFQEGKKKLFEVNGAEYEKLREHIGRFPVIFIAPNDTDLVREGSEIRRKFFDMMISQLDRNYLDDLMAYNHYLKNRNSLLKQFAESNRYDKALLEPYDQKLLELGRKIYLKRDEFTAPFNQLFLNQYNRLSGKEESVSLKYVSDFAQENYQQEFSARLKKDLALQRSTFGTHKDDFKFLIEGNPLKKFGSQGQQKSFVLALRLTHYLILNREKGFKPILLLDDIFDKLDSSRIETLINIISGKEFGQVFLTDARSERTKDLLQGLGLEARIYEISRGNIQQG